MTEISKNIKIVFKQNPNNLPIKHLLEQNQKVLPLNTTSTFSFETISKFLVYLHSCRRSITV